MTLYDSDFHAWARHQAELLRTGRFDELDRDNLAEEISSLGKSEERGLQTSYRLVMLHLLKWIYRPERRSASWQETIIRERSNVEDDIETFPGLKPKRDALFAKAYGQARKLAAKETQLPVLTFPIDPPFTRLEIEDDTYWP